jgi:uncharacterized protein DUF4429/putative oligomerization/nucleic acid binding protein
VGKRDQPLLRGTVRASGTNGEVLFDGSFVTIKHSWLAKSGRGESRYPIGAVTGVEVKPGVITCVFTLVVAGGVQRGDARGQRKGDPLSIEGGAKDRAGFMAMRDRILTALAERDRGAAPAAPAVQQAPVAQGLGDQLSQLAALHAQQVLSDAEFAAAKARLLGTDAAMPPSEPRDAPPTNR